MRGIVLASGLGTRLGLVTKEIVNKHLVLVYDRPMIFYPLETLVKSGIDDIAIVIGGSHCDKFIPTLKNGKELGIKKLTYIYQDAPLGIAHAIGLCEDFADGKNVAVILGDNYFEDSFSEHIKLFELYNSSAVVFLKRVADPERFGVAYINGVGRLEAILEKPSDPKSNLAVTGFYLYDSSVFDRIKQLKPSARNELEITDVNMSYLEEERIFYREILGLWSDMGTFESLNFVSAVQHEKHLTDKYLQ